MRRKTWYYRDGNFFYNKRAWENGREKIAKELQEARAKRAAEKAQAKQPAETPQAEATPAPEQAA
jgi:hypothetical protein